ncbi:metallophosphoesterase family protein [Streptacidiphilus sp. PB12-B1b]|uniref:metallophosphoesterase family protein n=1 Tax=Streptacidiphilus sp. PB12-B1b TaxID=2705012 RepID=UPI0015FDBBC7|nr:metallophosphoesterase family protein [Streptacidiphilus sp. PB12-B1b]QMU77879.1 metallophosphoesterase family protein [Streptacidiphilus sp. PB12-B1b]
MSDQGRPEAADAAGDDTARVDTAPDDTARYGPAPWEDGPRRLGRYARIAVLSDVHGAVTALEAVLAEPELRSADLVVLCGDLTWGPEPQRVHELIAGLGGRAACVRGNADRYAVEVATGAREPIGPREAWIPARHSPEALEFLARVPFSLVAEVDGLGPVRFCHGSPRSDHELVTFGTPESRFAELASGIEESTLVTGHTHLQFDRAVAGRRSVNPGSVGLPYHLGEPGTAYWALLGPDVQLRSTRYDPAQAAARAMESGDPGAERFVATLLRPPTPQEILADAEARVFSG